MGAEFEEIERRQFGKDGFEDAAAQVGQVEAALGYADLAGLTLRRRQRPDRAAHPRSSVQAGLEAGFSLTQRNSFQ